MRLEEEGAGHPAGPGPEGTRSTAARLQRRLARRAVETA